MTSRRRSECESNRSGDRLAQAKAIGHDVEDLVIETVTGLQSAANPDDWYDAVVTEVVGPRTVRSLPLGALQSFSLRARSKSRPASAESVTVTGRALVAGS